jgi:uncharacterized membrane protein YbjE (DUF340 family)
VIGLDALTVLVILLPGFLCAKLVQWLCIRPEQTELDKVVEALLYSFLVYVTFTLAVSKLELKRSHLMAVTLISCVLALLISALWTNDSLGPLLRKWRVTNRTSRPSVWNDVFHNTGGYVLVELADGRLIAGWVKFYSDVSTSTSLFLEDAAWITREGTQIAVDGPGVLITNNCGIKTVSFHTAKDNRVVPADKQSAKTTAAGA